MDLTRQIQTDLYLKTIYSDIYSTLLGSSDSSIKILEIGSGNYSIGSMDTRLMTSDIDLSVHPDIAFDAQRIPLRDLSIEKIILKDALHHIPDCSKFFDEANRILKPCGTIVMYEPYWGLLAQLVYRFIHQEKFTTSKYSWSFVSTKPFDSNQAIPYILFHREVFNKFAAARHFAISSIRPHLGPSFLLSGGVSRRTWVPSRFLLSMFNWECKQGNWFNCFRFGVYIQLTKVTTP